MARLRELDALRGLAACGVVFHHSLLAGAVGQSRIDLLLPTPLQPLATGRPFVLLFFVLSGFVLSRSLLGQPLSRTGYGAWVLQRLTRLILPALGSVLLAALLYHLAYGAPWHGETPWMRYENWTVPPSAGAILGQGFLVADSQLNNVLWSLVIEAWMSFAIPLLVWFVAASPRGRIPLLLLAALGVSSFLSGTPPDQLYNPASSLAAAINSTLYFGLPFALGIGLDRSGLCQLFAGRAIVGAALFAVAGFAQAGGDLADILGATLLVWLVQQPGVICRSLQARPLTWLGKISFSLYLVHVPLIVAAFHLLHGSLPDATIALLAITVAFAVAALFHEAVEAPAHRLARALKRRRVPPAELRVT